MPSEFVRRESTKAGTKPGDQQQASGREELRSRLEKFYDLDAAGKDGVMTVFLEAADTDVYPVLQASLSNNENDRIRNAAMELYVSLRRRSVPFLIALLTNENEEVRTFAAVMLGTMKDSDAVPALINALTDPDMNVKHAAAEALGKIGDSRAVEPLIDALMMDMWIQFPAAIALGDIGDSRAVKPLIALLPVPGANAPAIQALGKLAHPSALAPLVCFLEDDEPSLREWALEAIVEIFSRSGSVARSLSVSSKAKDILLRALVTGDRPGVRRNAAAALGYLRVREAISTLTALLENEELAETARMSLLKIEGTP